MALILDIVKAKKGDKDAFERIIRTIEVVLYRTSKAFLQSDDDCADAMQETVFRAYRSINSLKESAYFKTWITRILINECKRIMHRNRNVVSFSDDYIAAVLDPELTKIELWDIIDRLDSSHKAVAILYYYVDLSIKEIAKELKVPEGTVKSRLHRARELVALQLQGQPERSDTV
ncbi:sigma-70 family RNA polymerase sigma factor [Cohnella lupini]|uniref:RNA polymerase sigma (SigV) subunit n=1 Tax=Cohnella lupini TaxID=1294267 RepID=A0A3D9HQS4_9BACL|nr:sigma-70 family RNA polymerase sigma factor [Cohnella lupini]RED51651.1 RNA polymerase sigma (SigV) subunit [Cohnella lupini]